MDFHIVHISCISSDTPNDSFDKMSCGERKHVIIQTCWWLPSWSDCFVANAKQWPIFVDHGRFPRFHYLHPYIHAPFMPERFGQLGKLLFGVRGARYLQQCNSLAPFITWSCFGFADTDAWTVQRNVTNRLRTRTTSSLMQGYTQYSPDQCGVLSMQCIEQENEILYNV